MEEVYRRRREELGDPDELDIKAKDLEKEAESLSDRPLDLIEYKDKINEEISDLKSDKNYAMKEIENIDSDIEKVKKGKPCPTCKRPFSKDEIDKSLKVLLDKKKLHENKLPELLDKIDKLSSKLNMSSKLIKDKEGEWEKKIELNNKAARLRSDAKNIRFQLKQIEIDCKKTMVIDPSPYLDLIEKAKESLKKVLR